MLAPLTHWMEIALWVVLGSMAVDFLIGLFKLGTGGSLRFVPDFVVRYLKDILYYVLPLLVLASVSVMDSTGWIVLAGYYAGAVAVVLKYLWDIKAKL
ncbi:hypothetical protein [Cohnella candidum]|uniref:Holin n=1 Tax=Cohnella candidum TaxID=2674991 RepID=A0A3G3K2Q4_9BACL|nr:hypothetical protein [Cohnella candidum]AYQ74804.1 hypothetical protein EAV92_20970 [Cohnella candidum]